MFQAVYNQEIWHTPQEKIELLVFEKIILAPLIKIKFLCENPPEGVKKGTFTKLKGSCNQD